VRGEKVASVGFSGLAGRLQEVDHFFADLLCEDHDGPRRGQETGNSPLKLRGRSTLDRRRPDQIDFKAVLHFFKKISAKYMHDVSSLYGSSLLCAISKA
jgi:hypothetical protein